MAPVINGFLCSNDRAQIGVRTFTVPGTEVKVALRAETAPLLLEFMRWWHVTIEPINAPPIDDWGYAARSVRGSTSPSFHWAGIAVDVNATRHPLGKRGTVSKADHAKIVAKCNTLGLRWGGTYSSRADEMHAEVIVTRDRALLLVKALQSPAGSPPVKAPAPPAGGRPVLQLGDTGAAVRVAQDTLVRKGYTVVGKPDGKFGLNTQKGVAAFQRDRALAVDGVIGAVTWAALLAPDARPAPLPAPMSRWPEIREGATGAAVATIQRFLGILADGVFGPDTKRAVLRYRQMRGLPLLGYVDAAMWAATGL